MDNKTPVLTDSELVQALRLCTVGGPCYTCPFLEPGPTIDCVNKMLTAAADRIERSDEK